MLSYIDFKYVIDGLRDNHSKLEKIAEAINCTSVFELSMSNEVTMLLSHIFNDKDGWVDLWIYEKDFGRDWHNDCIRDGNDVDIDLSTTEKFYYFLIKNASINSGNDELNSGRKEVIA